MKAVVFSLRTGLAHARLAAQFAYSFKNASLLTPLFSFFLGVFYQALELTQLPPSFSTSPFSRKCATFFPFYKAAAFDAAIDALLPLPN